MATLRITAFDKDDREIGSIEASSGEVTIGRENDRQLVLPSAAVSRRHARIVLDAPQPFIVDEGSANGVLVNGVRISGPTAVVAGARVDIAEFHLEFAQGDGMTAAVAPIGGRGKKGGLRIVGSSGFFDGRVFEILERDMVIGRAVENDVVLDHPSLSRKHCRLRRTGARIEFEDMGSSNGTYLNGRRVQSGLAASGDELRFGECRFRIEGDAVDEDNTSYTPPARRNVLPFVLGAVALLGIGGGTAAFFLTRPPKVVPKEDSAARFAEQAAAHVKAGKANLADKKFESAVAELDQALELDPANTEARKLRAMAAAEPGNEKTARVIGVKVDKFGDRGSLEEAIKLLPQIPADSSFYEPTAKKLSTKLAQLGEAQCKAKKWPDCQWAICRAFEVAPQGDLPDTEADAALRDAEKKMAKDKTFVPCKRR